MKTVLIIGSEGFIGSYLKRVFEDCNLITADVRASSYNQHILLTKDDPNLEDLFKDYLPAICINASGAANVAASIQNPSHDYNLNVENVVKMLEVIKKYSSQTKFINISSAAVYGTPPSLPILDSESFPLNPISPYGKHKLESEKALRKYFVEFGIPTLSVRVFSCYGPGQDKLLLWDLYLKAKSNNLREVELFGTGNESRDYIHVEDLAFAIKACAEKAVFDGEAMNLANGEEVFIRDIVALAAQEIHKDLKVKFSGQERAGDPLRWQADISKLKSLGYAPKYSLPTGIKEYYSWVKSLRT